MCNSSKLRAVAEQFPKRDPFDPLNLPPGRDWANAEPTFDYGEAETRLHTAFAENPQQVAYALGARSFSLDEPIQFYRDPLYDRLSAPPRASRWQQVGLVARTLGKRLCDRHVASCAIVGAALIFLALTGLFALAGG